MSSARASGEGDSSSCSGSGLLASVSFINTVPGPTCGTIPEAVPRNVPGTGRITFPINDTSSIFGSESPQMAARDPVTTFSATFSEDIGSGTSSLSFKTVGEARGIVQGSSSGTVRWIGCEDGSKTGFGTRSTPSLYGAWSHSQGNTVPSPATVVMSSAANANKGAEGGRDGDEGEGGEEPVWGVSRSRGSRDSHPSSARKLLESVRRRYGFSGSSSTANWDKRDRFGTARGSRSSGFTSSSPSGFRKHTPQTAVISSLTNEPHGPTEAGGIHRHGSNSNSNSNNVDSPVTHRGTYLQLPNEAVAGNAPDAQIPGSDPTSLLGSDSESSLEEDLSEIPKSVRGGSPTAVRDHGRETEHGIVHRTDPRTLCGSLRGTNRRTVREPGSYVLDEGGGERNRDQRGEVSSGRKGPTRPGGSVSSSASPPCSTTEKVVTTTFDVNDDCIGVGVGVDDAEQACRNLVWHHRQSSRGRLSQSHLSPSRSRISSSWLPAGKGINSSLTDDDATPMSLGNGRRRTQRRQQHLPPGITIIRGKSIGGDAIATVAEASQSPLMTAQFGVAASPFIPPSPESSAPPLPPSNPPLSQHFVRGIRAVPTEPQAKTLLYRTEMAELDKSDYSIQSSTFATLDACALDGTCRKPRGSDLCGALGGKSGAGNGSGLSGKSGSFDNSDLSPESDPFYQPDKYGAKGEENSDQTGNYGASITDDAEENPNVETLPARRVARGRGRVGGVLGEAECGENLSLFPNPIPPIPTPTPPATRPSDSNNDQAVPTTATSSSPLPTNGSHDNGHLAAPERPSAGETSSRSMESTGRENRGSGCGTVQSGRGQPPKSTGEGGGRASSTSTVASRHEKRVMSLMGQGGVEVREGRATRLKRQRLGGSTSERVASRGPQTGTLASRVEAVYTAERMVSSGSGPSRLVACQSNHFTYYGPVPDGSDVQIGIIKYRYFCGASDSRGTEETRRAMGLGARVYFGKVAAASPLVCAGILRKENYKNYVIVFHTKTERFHVLQLNSMVRFSQKSGLVQDGEGFKEIPAGQDAPEAASGQGTKILSRMITGLQAILKGGGDSDIRITHLRDGTLKKTVTAETINAAILTAAAAGTDVPRNKERDTHIPFQRGGATSLPSPLFSSATTNGGKSPLHFEIHPDAPPGLVLRHDLSKYQRRGLGFSWTIGDRFRFAPARERGGGRKREEPEGGDCESALSPPEAAPRDAGANTVGNNGVVRSQVGRSGQTSPCFIGQDRAPASCGNRWAGGITALAISQGTTACATPGPLPTLQPSLSTSLLSSSTAGNAGGSTSPPETPGLSSVNKEAGVEAAPVNKGTKKQRPSGAARGHFDDSATADIVGRATRRKKKEKQKKQKIAPRKARVPFGGPTQNGTQGTIDDQDPSGGKLIKRRRTTSDRLRVNKNLAHPPAADGYAPSGQEPVAEGSRTAGCCSGRAGVAVSPIRSFPDSRPFETPQRSHQQQGENAAVGSTFVSSVEAKQQQQQKLQESSITADNLHDPDNSHGQGKGRIESRCGRRALVESADLAITAEPEIVFKRPFRVHRNRVPTDSGTWAVGSFAPAVRMMRVSATHGGGTLTRGGMCALGIEGGGASVSRAGDASQDGEDISADAAEQAVAAVAASSCPRPFTNTSPEKEGDDDRRGAVAGLLSSPMGGEELRFRTLQGGGNGQEGPANPGETDVDTATRMPPDTSASTAPTQLFTPTSTLSSLGSHREGLPGDVWDRIKGIIEEKVAEVIDQRIRIALIQQLQSLRNRQLEKRQKRKQQQQQQQLMRGQQQEQQQPQQQQQHWMQSGAPLGFVEVGSGDGAGRYLASHGGSAQNTNQGWEPAPGVLGLRKMSVTDLEAASSATAMSDGPGAQALDSLASVPGSDLLVRGVSGEEFEDFFLRDGSTSDWL